MCWILGNTHIRVSTCPHMYFSYSLFTNGSQYYILILKSAKSTCRKPDLCDLVKGVLSRPKSQTFTVLLAKEEASCEKEKKQQQEQEEGVTKSKICLSLTLSGLGKFD